MNTASESTTSSSKRALETLFHTVTTENVADVSPRVESLAGQGGQKSSVQLPHIPSPLRSPAQDAAYWKQSGQAFRVDRGHILGTGPAIPPSASNMGSASVATPVAHPVTPLRSDVPATPAARPISPNEITPRSLPAQTPESPQIEQIAEYLRRRQTEIANQHKDLSNIARQHQTQLQQQHELRQQRSDLLRRRLELSIENLRLRLIALGEQLSQQIAVSSPLFNAFEEACETFQEMKSTLKEFKS